MICNERIRVNSGIWHYREYIFYYRNNISYYITKINYFIQRHSHINWPVNPIYTELLFFFKVKNEKECPFLWSIQCITPNVILKGKSLIVNKVSMQKCSNNMILVVFSQESIYSRFLIFIRYDGYYILRSKQTLCAARKQFLLTLNLIILTETNIIKTQNWNNQFWVQL